MMKLGRLSAVAFCFFLATTSISAATYTVTKIADTNDGLCDTDCSLREAVAAANATAANDAIQFEFPLFNSTQTIVLSGTEIGIANNGSLTIDGPGADRLTLDGNLTSRIISTTTGVVATIRGIRFTRGNGVGAVNNNTGGAIMNNAGNLTLENSIVTGNTVSSSSGGARNSGTGSVMTINNCLFSNNTASTSSGGAIQNFSTSTLNIHNSTFSGNSAAGTVGGGAMQLNGMARISNSTFFANNSSATGGAIQSNGSLLLMTNVTISGNTSTGNGGGLNRATTNVNGFIRNSIIAGNNGPAASPDVTNSAGGLASQGNNIIGTVGTSTGWVGSDLQNTNPLLTPAGYYGGLGFTYVPLSGSPAIDGGQNCVLDLSCAANNPPQALTTDQRGAMRPFNSTVDIGAVEVSTAYTAVLPSAVANVAYNFTIAPSTPGFTYLLNSGSFGGITLTSNGSMAFLSGTPTQGGVFNAVVQITNGTNAALVNYQITIVGAASVSVSGRVLSTFGSPVSRALVTISNAGGVVATARTNTFGNFTLTGIQTGQTYTVNVFSKGRQFTPLMLVVNDEITNLEIIASSKN